MIVEGDAGLCVAFKTKLITINKKPQIMLFVEYPEQIEFIQLRHESRINTHLPVVISEQQASSNMLEGVVLDLSEGGCRIELAAPSQRLSMVFVQIILRFPLTPEKPIVLNGAIKSQQQTSDKLRVGIQFDANKQLKAIFNKLNMFNHPSFAV
ncbi:PilZ domain-containing protein [Agarivorans litoreus]|uniref:PilZ domain-containing protein n=1 Tax=Agarivorans litoreus TaxID=1510455 RepID=UPI001FEBB84D|nr:PilZ domain-containing protein [Agarivorans litoreus]